MLMTTYLKDEDIYACWSEECITNSFIISNIDFNHRKINSIYPGGFLRIVEQRRHFKDASFWMFKEEDRRFIDCWRLYWKNKKDKNGLLIEGPVGIGKTHFLIASIRDLMISGKANIEYLSEEQLFAALKRTYDKKSEQTEHSILSRFLHCDYLFYDDLGAACKSWSNDWAKQIIIELINHRYENNLQTFYTTNLNKNQRYEILGERIADRLSSLYYVALDGISKRRMEENEHT